MRDELFDREYQAGREALNSGIDRGLTRLGHALVTAFRTFHRIQWSAPWNRQRACR